SELRLLALEIGEERLVVLALEQGLGIDRRLDVSPWAVLYSGVEEAVQAAEGGIRRPPRGNTGGRARGAAGAEPSVTCGRPWSPGGPVGGVRTKTPTACGSISVERAGRRAHSPGLRTGPLPSSCGSGPPFEGGKSRLIRFRRLHRPCI